MNIGNRKSIVFGLEAGLSSESPLPLVVDVIFRWDCSRITGFSHHLGYWVMLYSVIRGGVSKTLGKFQRCSEGGVKTKSSEYVVIMNNFQTLYSY